jgi:hypothetical protein
VESMEAALAARLEICQIKLNELESQIHSMGEELKEGQPMARIKVSKR